MVQSGYVKFNANYLEEVNDVTNCYEKMTIANDNTILRAGPGFEHVEITTLESGNVITRIDNSGRYNFSGKVWDRVILPDGRQGFVTRGNLKDITHTEPENTNKNETTEGNIVNEIINNETINNYTNETNVNETINNEVNEINQNIIEEPGNNNVNDNNTSANSVEDENQTNQDGNEIISGNINENNTNENSTNENIGDDTNGESERKYLVISPEKMAKDLDGIVTKDGVQTEEAGTGYKIIINEKEYIIVKRGDANGDGYVKANDYLIIKDYIIGNKGVSLNDEYLQAADVTNDKAVKANDYLKIKDHIMYGVDL